MIKSITAFFRNIWFAQRNADAVVFLENHTERLNELFVEQKALTSDVLRACTERGREIERLKAELARFHTIRGANGRFTKKDAGK